MQPSIKYRIKNRIKEILFYLNFSKINSLSPVEKFSLLNSLTRFSGPYEYWRISRINQILEIFSVEELSNFRILEVGAGNCEIGAFFADLGAEVISLEGRLLSVNLAKIRWSKLNNLKIILSDLDKDDLSTYGDFDLIINFGLIYHIENMTLHLEKCSQIGKNLIIDTHILDSNNINFLKLNEDNDSITQSLNGIGCRPTINYLEKLFLKLGYKFKRLESHKLNSGMYKYDWKPKNDGKVKHGYFKMWHCYK